MTGAERPTVAKKNQPWLGFVDALVAHVGADYGANCNGYRTG